MPPRRSSTFRRSRTPCSTAYLLSRKKGGHVVVMFVYIMIVFFSYLVLAPLPPIYPRLPRPPHRYVHKPSTESYSNRGGSSWQQVVFTQEQAVKSTSEQASEQSVAAASSQELQQLYTRIAARSLGEGSFALAEIACTIKNRLRVSRSSLSAVLRAYRARDVPPQPHHVETVRQVFEGDLPCPPTWWYALSLQDTRYWIPHQRPPAKIVKQNERKQIFIFDR